MDAKRHKNDEEEFVETDYMYELMGFVSSEHFKDRVDSFFDNQCDIFLDLSELKDPSEGEQKLTYTTVFETFQALLNDLFAEFVHERRTTLGKLFENIADSLDSRYCPLFAEHENKWFVEDILFGYLDYTRFVTSMVARCNTKGRSARYRK